jgi:hypothetical protein
VVALLAARIESRRLLGGDDAGGIQRRPRWALAVAAYVVIVVASSAALVWWDAASECLRWSEGLQTGGADSRSERVCLKWKRRRAEYQPPHVRHSGSAPMPWTAALALGLSLVALAAPARPSDAADVTRFVAPPVVTAEIRAAVDDALARFHARDAAAVLGRVSEQYRSAGVTKPALRQQLLAMFAVYEELRSRVRIERVEVVDGRTEFFTTGDVSGRLPVIGWVTILRWESQPEVARREDGTWRLFGFQD